jgi:hypothetical protein
MNRPTAHKIYARGLVDLAISTPPLRDSELPETLELDRARISRIREDALRITTIGGILLTAKNLLKRDVRSQWKPQAARMWEVLKDGYLKDPSTPSKISSLLESSHNMPPSTRAQLSSTVTRLLTQAESGKLSDPVAKVLFQRLKTHIFNRVSASSSGERVKAASTATEGLATTGLAEFVPQVADICEQLSKLGEVDRLSNALSILLRPFPHFLNTGVCPFRPQAVLRGIFRSRSSVYSFFPFTFISRPPCLEAPCYSFSLHGVGWGRCGWRSCWFRSAESEFCLIDTDLMKYDTVFSNECSVPCCAV